MPVRIRVVFAGVTIADTVGAFRVLESSHPPNYYLPPGDVLEGCLTRIRQVSVCEWKGTAHYYDVTVGEAVAQAAAWGYDQPSPAFAVIAGFVAFYAAPMDYCLLGDEEVEPQPGGFYGGWITANLVGPCQRWPRHAGLVAARAAVRDPANWPRPNCQQGRTRSVSRVKPHHLPQEATETRHYFHA